MKIILDRRSCTCWEPACETHFGWHFLRGEITPVDCMVEILDDGRPKLTFYIKDRDQTAKVLMITEENRAETYEFGLQT